MIKYTETMVVFREFPDEVSLAINLSLCPNKCKNCHSKHLWNDIGTELTESELDNILKRNKSITCIGFMGGDNDIDRLYELMSYVKENYPLKIGWYTGKNNIDERILNSKLCDYIKYGRYEPLYGSIDCKNTNQKMIKKENNIYKDVTKLFWKKNN